VQNATLSKAAKQVWSTVRAASNKLLVHHL